MRSKRGSNIIEGVAGIFLVLAGILACTIFLINVVLVINYKQKLALVSNTATTLAAQLRPGAFHTKQNKATTELQDAKVEKLINEHLLELGLPAAKDVVIATDKRTGFQTVRVSFRVDGLGVIGLPGVFPSSISLSEDTAVVLTCKIPPALCQVNLEVPAPVPGALPGIRGIALMPSYGEFVSKFSGRQATPEPAKMPKGVAAFRDFDHPRHQASYFAQDSFTHVIRGLKPEQN